MRRAVLLSVVIGWMGAAAMPAQAQQIPAGCGGNESDFRIIRQPTNPARPGDRVTFVVYAVNTGISPCNISLATPLSFILPAKDGTPTGARTDIAPTGTSYAAGLVLGEIYRTSWVVDVNPGVADAVTEVSAGAKLFDAAVPHDFRVYRTLGTTVTQPGITIDKQGSIESGQAPQNVTYTFVVTNTSNTPVPMSSVRVADDKCGSPAYASGDDGDGKLSNGEKWTFTCAMLHQAAGVYTNTASACAYSDIDGREVCSPPDTWTVTLTPPPAVPVPVADSGVKPATATQAPCDIASPTGLTVRAKELTTIRVRVRNVDAGTEARITLPGGKVLRAKTNASGIATFKVRPPKSGRATIRIAECGDVARFTVRQPRQVQTRRAPRVTG